jgi:hypothetical protein
VRHAHRCPNPVSHSRPQRETQRPAMSQAKLAGNQRASNTTPATALQNRKFSVAVDAVRDNPSGGGKLLAVIQDVFLGSLLGVPS